MHEVRGGLCQPANGLTYSKKIIKYENNLNYVKYLCTYKSAVV